jgi:hypothetical protein
MAIEWTPKGGKRQIIKGKITRKEITDRWETGQYIKKLSGNLPHPVTLGLASLWPRRKKKRSRQFSVQTKFKF